MPRSQALLLWINETIPNKFKAVLSRARELDIGFGMRERAQATKIAVNDVVKTPIK
jgi:hypothetical protein